MLPVFDPQNSIALLLVFARVGSLMLTAPVFGSWLVPVKIRILLAVFLAIVILPLTPNTSLTPGSDAWVLLLFSEISIGIMLGLGVAILVSAAKMAGTVIGQLAGMQWTADSDTESSEPVTAISQLFGIVSVAVFITMGGPEMLTGALIDSYRNVPLGTPIAPASGLALLGELLQQSFQLTVRGVAPAVTSLLIGTFTIGMLSRAFPFMNMLGLGFNSNQFMFFLATFLTLGGCIWLFLDDVGGTLDTVERNLAGQP
jgi:flagellar biosynthetic protein FliR